MCLDKVFFGISCRYNGLKTKRKLKIDLHIIQRQGKCQNVECGMCGKEGAPQCSQCCISCSEIGGCSAPSVAGCLNKCCPNKKVCREREGGGSPRFDVILLNMMDYMIRCTY